MVCVSLVFLIPTLNEEKGVGTVIREIKSLKLPCKIYLTDAHSKDNTVKIATRLGAKVFPRKGFGKGEGIREMMQIIPDNDTVVITDGDATYSLARVPQMLKLVNDNTMITGSRFKGKLRGMPTFNLFGNKVQSLLLSVLFGTRITDVNTGLRVFKAKSLKKLKINSLGFDLEVEWTCKALKRGMRIIEVPADYRERRGATHLHPLRDGWRIIKRILKERVSD